MKCRWQHGWWIDSTQRLDLKWAPLVITTVPFTVRRTNFTRKFTSHICLQLQRICLKYGSWSFVELTSVTTSVLMKWMCGCVFLWTFTFSHFSFLCVIRSSVLRRWIWTRANLGSSPVCHRWLQEDIQPKLNFWIRKVPHSRLSPPRASVWISKVLLVVLKTVV